jgi:hypothetical protein
MRIQEAQKRRDPKDPDLDPDSTDPDLEFRISSEEIGSSIFKSWSSDSKHPKHLPSFTVDTKCQQKFLALKIPFL